MLIRSVWLLLLLAVAFSAPAQQTTRVAFGCCIDHTKRQEVWDAINHAQPEVFVFWVILSMRTPATWTTYWMPMRCLTVTAGHGFCDATLRLCRSGTATITVWMVRAEK